MLDSARKPVVFIGGIDLDNIDAVLRRGAKNIAVIRSIIRAEDISQAARSLKNKIHMAGEGQYVS